MKAAVLFVSPHMDDAGCLSRMLRPVPLAFDHVRDLRQARVKLRHSRYSVILTEAGLPDGSWLDVLSMAQEIVPRAEVIVTDRYADSSFWAEALNLGAYDLLAQPFYEPEVRRILSNACSRMMPEQAACSAL